MWGPCATTSASPKGGDAPLRGHAPAAARSPSTARQCGAWPHPARRPAARRPAPSDPAQDRPAHGPSTPPGDRPPHRLLRETASSDSPRSSRNTTSRFRLALHRWPGAKARDPTAAPSALTPVALRPRRPSSLHAPRPNHAPQLLRYRILPSSVSKRTGGASDGRHDSTDCSVPRPRQQAAHCDVRSGARQLGWRLDAAQGGRSIGRPDPGPGAGDARPTGGAVGEIGCGWVTTPTARGCSLRGATPAVVRHTWTPPRC